MKGYKIELTCNKLTKALVSLEAIVNKPPQEDRINIDATIQRFEFTIELFWKLLKHILESKGVDVQYPTDIMAEAYKGHLIDDEKQWLLMIKDRNLASPTYDEQLADAIYNRIKTYVVIIRKTFDKLNAH
jgi:nucleotidyltransferase substrate binding protein (TIGR01987 family)